MKLIFCLAISSASNIYRTPAVFLGPQLVFVLHFQHHHYSSQCQIISALGFVSFNILGQVMLIGRQEKTLPI
uniref:Uncharacterized protein n=1 Tax=Arion vulgaris TaxID=1028688 RepID=A0A0B6Z535_9EUPU